MSFIFFHCGIVRSSKFIFWHYDITWNSRFSLWYSMNLLFTLNFTLNFVATFFASSRRFVFPADFMQSFRVVDFFLPPINHDFFHIFAFLFHMLKISLRGLWFVIVSSSRKTGLCGSKVCNCESWFYFVNVWKSKREILVSRISKIYTILCSNLRFVWIHTRFRVLINLQLICFAPYIGQLMVFMYAIL